MTTKHDVIFSGCDSDLNSVSWNFDRHGYARTTRNKSRVFAHHIVIERSCGKRPNWQLREVCDHINGNKLDNRRENLRIVGIAENGQNRALCKYRGTTFNKSANKWQATVRHKGKNYYCGVFDDRLDAAKAAREKRLELGFFGKEDA